MTESPEYLQIMKDLIPEQLIDTIEEIEKLFVSVSHSGWEIEIDNILNTTKRLNNSAIRDEILGIYRKHVEYVLNEQHVFLYNASDIPLQRSEVVLRLVCKLGTKNINDLLEGHVLDETEDDLEWFINILSFLSGEDPGEFLQLISHISPIVNEVLRSSIEVPELDPPIMLQKSKDRFKALFGEEKAFGFTADMIRKYNSIGYDPKRKLVLIIEELETLVVDDELALEIYRYLMASDATTREFSLTAEFILDQMDISEHRHPIILSKIRRYMR